MKDEAFKRLIESVCQGAAILHGALEPSRVIGSEHKMVYDKVRVIATDDDYYGQMGWVKDVDEYGAIFVRFPGGEGAWYTPEDIEPIKND